MNKKIFNCLNELGIDKLTIDRIDRRGFDKVFVKQRLLGFGKRSFVNRLSESGKYNIFRVSKHKNPFVFE